jgi:hypothetical protein
MGRGKLQWGVCSSGLPLRRKWAACVFITAGPSTKTHTQDGGSASGSLTLGMLVKMLVERVFLVSGVVKTFFGVSKKREFFCFSPRTKGSKTGFRGNFQIACFPYGNAENMFEVLFFSQLRGFIFFFHKKRRRGV